MKNNKPKLFILAEHICADENSTGYFWSKLIEKLQSNIGFINVISPELSSGKTKPNSNINYICLKFRKFDKNKLSSRIFGQLGQAASFVGGIAKNVGARDLVLSGTNPALLLLIMPIAKMLWGFKWVVLVHDIFPDNLMPAGIVSKKSIAYRLLNRYSNWVYAKADLLVVIGRDMQDVLAAKTKNITRIRYIPNWVDGSEIHPMQRASSDLIKSLGWENKIVFQFFGNIGRVQGVSNILQSIKLIKSQDAAFLFIGGGAKMQELTQFIAENPTCNVRYVGEINQLQRNQGLSACDVAIVSLNEGMFGLGVPSKAYFSMAADRPLLAVMDKGSEIALTVEEHKIGWYCESGKPDMLASLIDKICLNFNNAQLQSSRKVFDENFTEKLATEKFSAEIEYLLTEGGAK